MNDEDREVAAARMIVDALRPLDDAQRGRVLKWAQDRFGPVGSVLAALALETSQALRERDELRSQVDAMTNAKPNTEAVSS